MVRRGSTLVLAVLLLVLAAAPAQAAGWRWASKGRIRAVTGSADSVSCPTTSLCVMAIGGNKVAWTTNPRGPARAWKKTTIAPAADEVGRVDIFEVDCPTARRCVAGSSHSDVITTSAPTGPAAGWSLQSLPSDTFVGVESLSCASATFCGALDVAGYALITSDGVTWNRTRIVNRVASSLYDMTCVPGLCAATQADSRIYLTSAPTAVPARWTSARFRGTSGFAAVECASKTLCVAARGVRGTVYASTRPTGGSAAWKQVGAAGAAHLYCQSRTACFALGQELRWSPTPSRRGSWRKTLTSNQAILSAMSCPTSRMCVLVDVGGHVWVGTR